MPGFVVNGSGGFAGKPEQMNSRLEYKFQYMWDFLQPPRPAGLDLDDLLVGLKDATTPTFSVQSENYVGSSVEYKFAKNIVWDDVRFTWYDHRGLIKVLKKWRQLVWSEEGGLGVADEYKHTTMLRTYLQTGEVDNTYRLTNSWPRIIKYGDLTYAGTEVQLIQVTVAYDWCDEALDDQGQ